jgi:hypothetical protein
MSVKSACPACSEHSTRVADAFGDSRPCPNCGLSYEAVAEIREVQRSRGDEELKAKLTEEVKRRGIAEAKVARLEYRIQQLREALDAPDPDWLGA